MTEGNSSLRNLLQQIIEQAEGMRFTSRPLGILEALESDDMQVWLEATTSLNDFSKELREAVVRDERFLGDSMRFASTGLGAMGFYPSLAGQHLVIKALQTKSADAAIAWLKTVLETNETSTKTIQSLWGVPVAEAFDLTPNVQIMPISDLPDTKQRRHLMEPKFRSNPSPLMSMLDHLPFDSALVINHTITPLYDPETEQEFPTANQFLSANDLLKEIALALTVIGPRMAITGIQWIEFDDPDFFFARSGYTNQMLEVLPMRVGEYPPLDATEAKEIVSSYLALDGSTRKLVRVALQRISQSLRRHNAGDAAVELSTALEALLGDNATTEMTHKVKVRAVRLIGGSAEERRRNATIISKTYTARSKLVHTGQVNETDTDTLDGERVPVRRIVDQALLLCVKLVKIIIRRGEVPNWAMFDITEQR